jgi:hypothetical protein
MISDAWKLEGAVGDVIRWHHNCESYEGQYKDVLYSVAAANWFANTAGIGFSGDRYPEKIEQPVWEYLGIDRDSLASLEGLVNQEIERAQVFLNLGKGEQAR